jgi:hypothetical protein
MRKLFVALSLCLCSLAMHGQKTRFGQELPHAQPGDNFPIKVHISGIHYRREYVGAGNYEDEIYADAAINGRKVELRGDQGIPFQYIKLELGDHQARLLKDPHKIAGSPIFQEYEVVLPDRTVWRSTVTGVLE